MPSPFDISGRVVLVTGSSRGIGRGVAEHLASEGATVVVHARRRESLQEVSAAVTAHGAEVLAVTADVRDAPALAAAVAEIEARFGRLDGVVVGVGGAGAGPAAEFEIDRWRRQLDLNLTSAFATAQAAYPLLRVGGGGSVVLVSATAAVNPMPGLSAYGAAKAGVEQLTTTLAAEWGPEVRVNCVSPGIIRTDGSFQAVFGGDEDRVARAGRTTAVGRIGEPADIACACQYLLCDGAGYVSGAVLVVDGGPAEGLPQRIARATRA